MMDDEEPEHWGTLLVSLLIAMVIWVCFQVFSTALVIKHPFIEGNEEVSNEDSGDAGSEEAGEDVEVPEPANAAR